MGILCRPVVFRAQSIVPLSLYFTGVGPSTLTADVEHFPTSVHLAQQCVYIDRLTDLVTEHCTDFRTTDFRLKAYAVVGSGYGDCGKGLMTDFFCEKKNEDDKVLNIKVQLY